MKPKITFADIIEMCKVYTENIETARIPADLDCDISYNPKQLNIVTFSFGRSSRPVCRATLFIVKAECKDDEYKDDKLVLVITPSSLESIRMEIPIDIEYDSYRKVSTFWYESDHVVHCLETWGDIIHKLRIWYDEFNTDPNIAKKTYDAVVHITPEMIKSMIAHKVITQEQGNAITGKIADIKSGRIWPNINHSIR